MSFYTLGRVFKMLGLGLVLGTAFSVMGFGVVDTIANPEIINYLSLEEKNTISQVYNIVKNFEMVL